jgi:preprotein translocase subunit SecA
MLEAIFQNPSQQVTSKYKPQLKQINALETFFKGLTDLELKEKNK